MLFPDDSFMYLLYLFQASVVSPDRFRQLEVLQQVTTAFTSLVGSSSSLLKAQLDKDLPPEARERRRRMGMLFRRASKKSLSQMRSQKALDLSTADVSSAAPGSLHTPPNVGDKKVPIERQMETGSLSPLAEELGAGQEPQAQPQSLVVSVMTKEATLKPGAMREGHPLTVMSLLQRKKNQWQAKESFEMEEASQSQRYYNILYSLCEAILSMSISDFILRLFSDPQF